MVDMEIILRIRIDANTRRDRRQEAGNKETGDRGQETGNP